MGSHRATAVSILYHVREKDCAREQEYRGGGYRDRGNMAARERGVSAGGSQRRNIWVGSAKFHERRLER